MILALMTFLVAASEPILTGKTFGDVAVPYVRCLTERQNAFVLKLGRGDISAASEAEAANVMSQIKARILASCASQRRQLASRAMQRLTKSSPLLSANERRAKANRFVKEVDQTFDPLIVVPIASKAYNASN
jgi:hypothetical protein